MVGRFEVVATAALSLIVLVSRGRRTQRVCKNYELPKSQRRTAWNDPAVLVTASAKSSYHVRASLCYSNGEAMELELFAFHHGMKAY